MPLKSILFASVIIYLNFTFAFNDEQYRNEYIRRLNHIGFTYEESMRMFDFELKAGSVNSDPFMLGDSYYTRKYFNLSSRVFINPFDWYVNNYVYTCSEIVKIWEEAEQIFKDKDQYAVTITPDALNEIYAITKAGGSQLLNTYARFACVQASVTADKMKAYLLSEFKLVRLYGRGAQVQNPYNS